jgi:hypothetical protein
MYVCDVRMYLCRTWTRTAWCQGRSLLRCAKPSACSSRTPSARRCSSRCWPVLSRRDGRSSSTTPPCLTRLPRYTHIYTHRYVYRVIPIYIHRYLCRVIPIYIYIPICVPILYDNTSVSDKTTEVYPYIYTPICVPSYTDIYIYTDMCTDIIRQHLRV